MEDSKNQITGCHTGQHCIIEHREPASSCRYDWIYSVSQKQSPREPASSCRYNWIYSVSQKQSPWEPASSCRYNWIYSVSQKTIPPWGFLTFFPNSWEFLVQILYTYYKFLYNYPTVTKLCHIKCNHPACVSTVGGYFEHIMVIALNVE